MSSSYEHIKRVARQTKPSLSYRGRDFIGWRKEARAKLSELLGMDQFQLVAPEVEIEFERHIEGATEIRFSFQSEQGFRTPCHLLLPDGVENPPVMICLQGHTSGMHLSLGRPYNEEDVERLQANHAMTGDGDFCIRAVKEGFAEE